MGKASKSGKTGVDAGADAGAGGQADAAGPETPSALPGVDAAPTDAAPADAATVVDQPAVAAADGLTQTGPIAVDVAGAATVPGSGPTPGTQSPTPDPAPVKMYTVEQAQKLVDEATAGLRDEIRTLEARVVTAFPQSIGMQEMMAGTTVLAPEAVNAVRENLAKGGTVDSPTVANLIRTLDVASEAAAAAGEAGQAEHIRNLEEALKAARRSIVSAAGDGATGYGSKGTALVLTREQFDNDIKKDCVEIEADARSLRADFEALRVALPAKDMAPETDGELESLETLLASLPDPVEMVQMAVADVKKARETFTETKHRQERRLNVAEQNWRNARDIHQHGAPLVQRGLKRLEFLRAERAKRLQAESAAALAAAAGR